MEKPGDKAEAQPPQDANPEPSSSSTPGTALWAIGSMQPVALPAVTGLERSQKRRRSSASTRPVSGGVKRVKWQADESNQQSSAQVDGGAGHGAEDGGTQDDGENGSVDGRCLDGEGSGAVSEVPPAEDRTGGEDPLDGENMNVDDVNVPAV